MRLLPAMTPFFCRKFTVRASRKYGFPVEAEIQSGSQPAIGIATEQDSGQRGSIVTLAIWVPVCRTSADLAGESSAPTHNDLWNRITTRMPAGHHALRAEPSHFA